MTSEAPERIWFNGGLIDIHMHTSLREFAGGIEYVRADARPVPADRDELERRADEEAEASRMRPEVLDPAPVSGWRDMESAPKDGAEVIGRHYKSGKRIRLMWYFKASSMTEMWRDENGNEFKPDAWMPLPNAPTSQPATEQDAVREADLTELIDFLDWERKTASKWGHRGLMEKLEGFIATIRSLTEGGERS